MVQWMMLKHSHAQRTMTKTSLTQDGVGPKDIQYKIAPPILCCFRRSSVSVSTPTPPFHSPLPCHRLHLCELRFPMPEGSLLNSPTGGARGKLEGSRSGEETCPCLLACCTLQCQCQASSAAPFNGQTRAILSEAALTCPEATLPPLGQSSPTLPKLNPTPTGTNSSQQGPLLLSGLDPPSRNTFSKCPGSIHSILLSVFPSPCVSKQEFPVVTASGDCSALFSRVQALPSSNTLLTHSLYDVLAVKIADLFCFPNQTPTQSLPITLLLLCHFPHCIS